MKLRSLLIALTLGFILCLAPVITAYLPNTLLWRGAAHLAEDQATHSIQTHDSTPQLAVQPNPDPPTPTGAGDNRETAVLLVAKQASPALVKAGDPLTYTIVVTNTGATTAHNIAMYDELPAGVRFRGESTLTVIKGDNPQLQVTEHQITGTVSTLQTTGRIIFIGRAIVDPTANGTILSNTALVTATNNSSSNNRATAETILLTATPTPTPTSTATPPATPATTPTLPVPITATAGVATPAATAVPDLADLQIRKSAAPDPIMAGTIVTYTIVVNNLGPGRAHNLVVRDTLPPDLFFDGHSTLSVLRGEQPQLLLSRTQLTGTIAMLNVGGLITITAPVRAPIVMVNQIRVNQARVTATTPDQQAANNSASTPLTLFPAPIMEHKNFLPAITK